MCAASTALCDGDKQQSCAAERVCFCLCVCLIAGLQECTARMCWTPAGLWHFLSVYLTAYPPQDYREKKRKERWQEHPFPSHTLFPHFYNSHTHTHAQKISTKSVIHLQMCSSLSVFPVEERVREGEGGAEMERHREQAAVYFSARQG